MKISDILWKAANECLWHGQPPYHVSEYSCTAAAVAELGWAVVERMKWLTVCRQSKAVKFMRELGCPSGELCAFDSFTTWESRQGARYLWLMFAYEVAKSEGL